MAQIQTKFIATKAVTAVKLGSGAATSVQPLFADGSGGAAYRSIVAGDIPTLNQNTTGTASNITASSNSTLTTLTALTTANALTSATSLALSGSQISGGTFGAVNGSALTNLSAAALSGVLPVGVTGGSGLSIATSQLTGTVSLTTQVSGVLPIANGGTNISSYTTGDTLYASATNVLSKLPIGSTGQVLTVVGGVPAWSATSQSVTVTEDIDTLASLDITNQYVDLLHVAEGTSASVNSISLNVVGGPEQLKALDYTVALTGGAGGVTRITFAGDLATGGNAALVAGDILMIKYAY